MAIVEEVLGIEGGACDRHAGREEAAGQEEDAGAVDKHSSELLHLPRNGGGGDDDNGMPRLPPPSAGGLMPPPPLGDPMSTERLMAMGRQHDEERGHAHNNQIDHVEGGVVGDDNDNDGHDKDDDDDNYNDRGCSGRDGHYQMRKGRGHNDRTNTTIK